MTLYAYDGASPFSLTAAKAHGAILITGYIVGHPGGYNPIDRARVNEIRSMGMGFLPNWERGADYLVSCGYDGGVAAGREAVAACEALGVPHGKAVVFSWDTFIHPADYVRCGRVADGIIAGLGGKYRFSAYGQGGLIAYFRATGRMPPKGWLSASSSFPGFDAASKHVGLVQQVGSPVAGTDQNIVTDPHNLGAWWPDGSPYASGGGMALDADVKARFDSIDAALSKLPGEVLGDDVVPVNLDPKNPNWAASSALGYLVRHVTVLQAALDPAKLAAAVVAALPPAQTGGLTVADVEKAVTDVLTHGTAATP